MNDSEARIITRISSEARSVLEPYVSEQLTPWIRNSMHLQIQNLLSSYRNQGILDSGIGTLQTRLFRSHPENTMKIVFQNYDREEAILTLFFGDVL